MLDEFLYLPKLYSRVKEDVEVKVTATRRRANVALCPCGCQAAEDKEKGPY